MASRKKIDLHWASIYNEANSIGNAYGYKVHNDTLRKYVSKIANITEKAENSLLITSPEYIKISTDKVNWVFSMFEGTTLPDVYVNKLKHADFWLTPSNWVRDLFCQYFDPDRIFVVNHGVESVFSYKKRSFPQHRPFRFFWLGAPNPRKGWEEIIHTWKLTKLEDDPRFELYLKTTRVGGIKRQKNVIIDGRNLNIKDLVGLYHEAHCFLFPTRGEGFGLTLAEAMRTGLPCISTDYSGCRDFFDKSVGVPIGFSFGDGKITFIGDNKTHSTKIAFPNVDEMCGAMVYIYENYKDALKLGERASARIRSKFTWENSARTLINLIEEHGL